MVTADDVSYLDFGVELIDHSTATPTVIKNAKDAFDEFKYEVVSCDSATLTGGQTCDDHTHFGFQLAWKVDACTVAVLEWEQNWSPLTDS